MFKNFLIITLFCFVLALCFFISSGTFCHLDYIKPHQSTLIPSFLGVNL